MFRICCCKSLLKYLSYIPICPAGPPSLQDDFMVKILENTSNVTINLQQELVAFPEPTLFSWSKDGQPLMADLVLTYSNVTFATVRRADTGNYTITATNFVLPGSPGTDQVGNDTGSFYLDVICKSYYCVCTFIVDKTYSIKFIIS